MNLIFTPEYQKFFQHLPLKLQRLGQQQQERLSQNSRDPRLHTKRLQGLDGVYSFRVTRRYRGLFYFQNPETIVLFELDHRKDVYR